MRPPVLLETLNRRQVPYRGPIDETIRDLQGGVRSACTYVGASTLRELPKRTTFIRCTQQLNNVVVHRQRSTQPRNNTEKNVESGRRAGNEKSFHAASLSRTVFRRFGLTMNFSKGKSEVMLQLRGRGAPDMRKQILLEDFSTIVINDEIQWRVTTSYTHLGVRFAQSHSLDYELRDRLRGSSPSLVPPDFPEQEVACTPPPSTA
eukprot:Skav235660  [mRNA]  locus=scaffold358:891561:893507:+ [translate_table: standard]